VTGGRGSGGRVLPQIKLEIGQENTVVEVQSSEVAVNTEQAEVQGVLTASQISNLPVNGRNFLDLAQLEPGVQIQDETNFDPTKVGYSSISFGSRFNVATLTTTLNKVFNLALPRLEPASSTPSCLPRFRRLYENLPSSGP